MTRDLTKFDFRRRGGRFALVLGGLIGAMLLGLSTYLLAFDLSPHAERLEAALSEAFAFEVKIGGPVRLHLSPRPQLSMGTVRADGAPEMVTFTAQKVLADLGLERSWPPALSIRGIRVSGALLDFESPRLGDLLRRSKAEEILETLSSARLKVSPIALVFAPQEVSLSNSSVRVRTVARETVVRIERATLTGDQHQLNQLIVFGETDGRPFSLAGAIEDARLLLGREPFDVKGVLRSDGANLKVDGKAMLGGAPHFEGTLKGDLKDAASVAGGLGAWRLPAVPAQFDLHLNLSPHIGDIKGRFAKLGEGDLEIDAGYALTDTWQLIGAIRSDLLDLATLDLGVWNTRAGRLISDRPLPVEALRNGRVDLTITSDRTVLGGQQFGPLRVALWADKGIWVSGPAMLRLEGGDITADMIFDVRADPRLTVTLSVESSSPSKLFAAAGLESVEVDGRLDLAAEIYGTGDSLGEMAAGAQGQTNLLLSTGHFPVSLAHWMPSAVAFGADRLVTYQSEPAPDIALIQQPSSLGVSCFVSRMDIEDGIARSVVFLLDTDHSVTAGQGSIDLASERIDFDLRPRPKDPSKLSGARDVSLEGPLLRPRIVMTEDKRRGLARATGATSLLAGPKAMMPLLSPKAVLANPCVRDAMGETAVATAAVAEAKAR